MNKIVIRKKEENKKTIGYDILESGCSDLLISASFYFIQKDGIYLLCFEDAEKDYFRMGSKRADIEKAVFSHTVSEELAIYQAYQKAREFAKQLAQRRQYNTIEDLTEEK